jgi:hypothetical protein
MEFATEMVAKSALHHLRIAEIPITYHPDGRTRRPHLRTWSDGWRHLKFMLLLSPPWVFIQPGAALAAIGLIGLLWSLAHPSSGDPFGEALTLALGFSILSLIGAQVLIFGVLSRLYAGKMGLLRSSPFWDELADALSIDKGLVVGVPMTLVGAGGIALALDANDPQALLIGLLVLIFGTQIVFLSFIVSLIRIKDSFR